MDRWIAAALVLMVGCGGGGDDSGGEPEVLTGPDCLRAVAAGALPFDDWHDCIDFGDNGDAARIAALVEERCLREVEAGLRGLGECSLDLDAEAERQGCHLASISVETMGAMVDLELARRGGADVRERSARVLRAAAGRIDSLANGVGISAEWGCPEPGWR